MKRKFFRLNSYLMWFTLSLILFCLSVVFMMIGATHIGTLAAIGCSFIMMILIPTYLIHLLKLVKENILCRKVPYAPKGIPVVNPMGYQRQKMRAFYLAPNGEAVGWWRIFVCVLVFFPIGIYYLIRKLMYEKVHCYEHGIRLLVMGGGLMLTMTPFLVWILTGETLDIREIVLLASIPGIYFLMGIAFMITGILLRKQGAVYEKYLILILNYHVTNLDVLKNQLHTTYSEVSKQLKKMIELDLLEDSYIYHKDRELIVPGISKKIALRCRSCSATTVLYTNEEQVCAYCGGELS